MSNEPVQQGQAWLEQVLKHCGIESSVSSDPPPTLGQLKDFGGHWLTIDPDSLSPDQLEVITGRNAMVLDAMQYLLTSTLNLEHTGDERIAYTLELGSLRIDRYQKVAALATEAADTVRQTGEEYEMPSLTSAERRLVHTVLYDETDLQTQSRGEEPDRRLVISPVTDESEDFE